MQRAYLVAVLLCACQAFACAAPACATPNKTDPDASVGKATGEGSDRADPVIIYVRSKLSDKKLRSEADPTDLAALEAFYGSDSATPLWITDMGLSARGRSALFEIEKANDWGLDAGRSNFRPQVLCRQAWRTKHSPRSSSISPFCDTHALLARAPKPAFGQRIVGPKLLRCAIRRWS
jgi:Scaffold domain